MRNFTLPILASALVLGAAAWPAPASLAQSHGEDSKHSEQEVIRAAVRRGEVMPLPRILAIARSQVPGDVIKVELERERWGIKYEVKILTATGRVREVELNAKTGALIEIEEK